MSDQSKGNEPPGPPSAKAWKEVEVHRFNIDLALERERQAGLDRRHNQTLRLIGAIGGVAVLVGSAAVLSHYVDKAAAYEVLKIGGYFATGLGGWLFHGAVSNKRRALPAKSPSGALEAISPG